MYSKKNLKCVKSLLTCQYYLINWKFAVKDQWWNKQYWQVKLCQWLKRKINTFELTIKRAWRCDHMQAALLHCCRHSRCDSTWVLLYSDSQCFYYMTHIRNLTGTHINTDRTQLNWSFTMNGLFFFLLRFLHSPSSLLFLSTTFFSSLLFCTARRYELQALTPGN